LIPFVTGAESGAANSRLHKRSIREGKLMRYHLLSLIVSDIALWPDAFNYSQRRGLSPDALQSAHSRPQDRMEV